MRNLNLIAALFIIAVFTLTSCQKDNLNEFSPTKNLQRQVPTAGIHTVNEAAKTLASYEVIENGELEARAQYAERITCNTGIITSTNEGAGNTIHQGNGDCVRDYGDTFNGPDKFYYFKVETDSNLIMSHHFVLSDMQDDLDLFLYTLDEYGYIRDCKATSITIGLDAETIDVTGLNNGYYLLVVDGWIEQAVSPYTLEIYCSAITVDAPSVNVIDIATSIDFGEAYEDGSSYHVGHFYRESAEATTWKKHFAGLPHFETFEHDVEFIEVGRGDDYLFLYDGANQQYAFFDIANNQLIYTSAITNEVTARYDILDIKF